MTRSGYQRLTACLLAAGFVFLAQPREAEANLRVPLPRPAVGLASWYGDFHVDKMTASGEIFRKDDMTAAHPTLPFGSEVRVTNLANKRSVVLRVTDRGPFTGNRIIDVSEAAAKALNFKKKGITRVMLTPLDEKAAY